MHLGGQVGAGGAGQDDGRGDDAGKHSERMLQTEQEGEQDGQSVVESKKGCGLDALPHEGQVGRKEEGIVVVADESIAGEKGSLESVDSVAEGRLVGGVGSSDRGWRLILVHGDGRRGKELRLQSKELRVYLGTVLYT